MLCKDFDNPMVHLFFAKHPLVLKHQVYCQKCLQEHKFTFAQHVIHIKTPINEDEMVDVLNMMAVCEIHYQNHIKDVKKGDCNGTI